jgi:hypothetical protein
MFAGEECRYVTVGGALRAGQWALPAGCDWPKSLAYRATPALWFAMPCDRKQLRGLRMEGADKGCVHSEYYSMG